MDTKCALRRVLVPLDGSDVALRTIGHVEKLLRASTAEVLLLRALPWPLWGAEGGRPVLDAITEAEVHLGEVEHRLEASGIRAKRMVVPGPPADAILDTAAREHADLIVIGTHGRTGLARFGLGGVAGKVVEASLVPLLLVPSHARSPVEFRRILVPFDGSAQSLKVADAVRAVGRGLDAHVHLVHVLEPHWEGVTWAVPERPMKEAADRFIEACLPTTTEIRKGDPALQILEAAAEQRSDMIAMATHGRTGPARWALGSVTEKVLHAANLPLLIVRACKED